MKTKLCSKCGFYFSTKRCRVCANIYAKKYRESHKKEIQKNQKQHYHKNKTRICKRHKRYYKKNKNKILNQCRKYYQTNKKCIIKKNTLYVNKYKKKKLGYLKKYRNNNRNKAIKYSKQYYKDNREEMKKEAKRYRKANAEAIRRLHRAYNKHKRKTDPIYALRMDASRMASLGLQKNGGSKEGNSFYKRIGYSPQQLMDHLMNHPEKEKWMTPENRGIYNTKTWNDSDNSTKTWQLDHIIPHSTFRYKTMRCKAFRECWALSNLRPLSAKQNNLDGARKTRH